MQHSNLKQKQHSCTMHASGRYGFVQLRNELFAEAAMVS
jgi:hypothetical protein